MISVVVAPGNMTTVPVGFDKCLSASHRCERGVSYEEAARRLDLSPSPGDGSSLQIAWDSERNEFFWESVESGERVRYHEPRTDSADSS